jgi:hypothetical protein
MFHKSRGQSWFKKPTLFPEKEKWDMNENKHTKLCLNGTTDIKIINKE